METNGRGRVVAIFLASEAGSPMNEVGRVKAVAGRGLAGDRYAKPDGDGSWNKGRSGNRQVTLINGVFFRDSDFTPADSRRNIVVEGIELMSLIGKEFEMGGVRMRGVKYCEPCDRPSKLSGKPGFREAFHDRGGLIAEVLVGGTFSVGDYVIPFVGQPSPAQP